MKRRNADCGKLRRPMKRNKITEGMYGSTTVLYMKFLVLWAIVITADFMFMFRFEFLWPFWLLLRSVHDSFKYKGLAFSVLFVCIAITSDLVCLFFIPVHWLLFAASTYVWVQYVWHTDKGICLPTIILWMLFVYLEAGIRWKDSRHMPHLDLCRPFAAHCIGYPVVTLGFGFKSYVGYRMRQRKQREVAKENEFYMQLLQQALPQDELMEEPQLIVNNAVAVPVSSSIVSASTLSSSSSQSAQSSSHASSTVATVTGSANATTLSSTANANIQANGILAAQAQTHQSSNHIEISDQHTQHNNTGSNSNNLSISATSLVGVTGSASHSNPDDKNYVQISGGGGGSATSNGHIGGHTKTNRRSVDKESRNRSSNTSGYFENDVKHNKSNCYQLSAENCSSNNNSAKEKVDWDNCQVHQSAALSSKDKHEDHRNNSNSNSNFLKKVNSQNNASGSTVGTSNGNVLQYDAEDVVVEPVERTKGRRNRSKKDTVPKDNHHTQMNNANNNSNNNNNNNTNNNNNNNNNNTNSNSNISNNNSNHLNNNNHHHNHNQSKETASHNHISSDTSSVSSSSSTVSSASTGSTSASTSSTLSNLASKMVSKICESCLKLEADVKKYRSEISHMKQIENELRQKLESNLTTKSCLQAKQKECDELEKRINELNNARHSDMLQLQSTERRLTEERRQKQSLEAQLNNEKKARKLAEEKAARPECSTQCKQRKQQIEEEVKQLRRELKVAEEGKQIAEQHGRKWEQELRMFEAEIRNRDSNQPGTEMLMNALEAMHDKNCTLEKNLSAETRVKLDLFSALGDAKRQLEISESRRRAKEDEVLDLKAKIAQLLAVMPTDTLCMQACNSTGGSSILRMNDTPPLQTGPGPSSPMLSSLGAPQQSNPGGHQLNVRVSSAVDYVKQSPSDYVGPQQQCAGVVPVSVATAVLAGVTVQSGGPGGSNLDPNATIYTPKGDA